MEEGVWSWGFREVVQGQMLPQLNKVEVKRVDAIKSNVLDSSNGKEKHKEWIRQGEGKKYLRESCYHHIKCSETNSLAALMWRWYLNNDI